MVRVDGPRAKDEELLGALSSVSMHWARLQPVPHLQRSKTSSSWGPPDSRGPQIYKNKKKLQNNDNAERI